MRERVREYSDKERELYVTVPSSLVGGDSDDDGASSSTASVVADQDWSDVQATVASLVRQVERSSAYINPTMTPSGDEAVNLANRVRRHLTLRREHGEAAHSLIREMQHWPAQTAQQFWVALDLQPGELPELAVAVASPSVPHSRGAPKRAASPDEGDELSQELPCVQTPALRPGALAFGDSPVSPDPAEEELQIAREQMHPGTPEDMR